MRRKLRNSNNSQRSEPERGASASFDDVLTRELHAPTVIESEPDLVIDPADGGLRIDSAIDLEVMENDRLRAEMLAGRTGTPATPATAVRAMADPEPRSPQRDFWDRYDEATAAAELFTVPPAAITVVVGSLDVAVPVARLCRAGHWAPDCDVFVLTEHDRLASEPGWICVDRPSDVVAVLEGGQSDFPLIVLDIPRELPSWIRPLIARLRQSGIGLVRYVLGGDPNDEDLATWHGELGRPAVLDLAAPVAPERVLQLLDRGEPVASVAGMPITTELLLALRLNR